MRQLVFVHGRSQQGKDPVALKREWIDAFRKGLAKSGLDLPIQEEDIRFPYYGQSLFDLVSGLPPEQVAEIVVKGKGDNGLDPEQEFVRSILEEVRQHVGVTDEMVQSIASSPIQEKGILNWEWIHTGMKALDRFIPGASSGSIALFTCDVYRYLSNGGIRDSIEMGVRKAFTPGVETVVVSHSLGTIVAYNILRRDGKQNNWKVPLHVTLGSPLGIRKIRMSLAPNKHPECVKEWFNAMDERDFVALYTLDDDHFPLDRSIENKTNVDNHTSNRHGISGYLDDKEVARRIYDALVA